MPSSANSSPSYTLGLDLGSGSLGWALIALDDAGQPTGLLRAGVRVFEPGVEGSTLQIEQGKDQSKAVERRTERLHRRQLRRRAARHRELFELLQAHSLLPPGKEAPGSSSKARHALFNALDQQLQARFHPSAAGEETGSFAQLPLYVLRKAGLDEKLEPYEFGRVLYHLMQRRGFKSNRREFARNVVKEKELGAVKAGISQLQQEMEQANARTLGEYFSMLDPHKQKIRRRWTARAMYEHEFELLWQTQAFYCPEVLTPELRAQIATLLFFQRPIAAQRHLIGKCDLEPARRRASWATLEAQRFRILQELNDLKLILPGNPEAQPLMPEQRATLYTILDEQGDQTFAAIRKHLGLVKTVQFNLERGEEKRLRGNRTNTAMKEVFGDRWAVFSEEDRNKIVEDWRTSDSEESAVRRGMSHWGLSGSDAKRWAEKHPEHGYCRLSRKAISRLLPLMAAGIPFKEAETKIYGQRLSGGEPCEQIPIVRDTLKTLRNPFIERSLTELRKVVNAIVREYGKPYEVRIELTRELKRPRHERIAATQRNRKRQSEREALKAKILHECGLEHPSPSYMERAMLYKECAGICPYTGRFLPFSELFDDSQFDVELILPLYLYPDDSFQNKTLRYREGNRSVPWGETPFEPSSADEENWAKILERVKKFNNPGKLKRFMLRSEKELQEFRTQQMKDTRYPSVLAGKLLETLYGGQEVATSSGTRQAVFTSSGSVTATLRRIWGLESILRESLSSTNGRGKRHARTDHRHHAIDAITVALTKQSVIDPKGRAASADLKGGHSVQSFRTLPAPWTNFVASVRPHIEGMIVSHRPEHKINGELHGGTNYGQPYTCQGKPTVHIRKPVHALSGKEIEAIVDDQVRRAVAAKSELLAGDLSRCVTYDTWPYLQAKDGRRIPIKRVRVKRVLHVTRIASEPRQRFVAENRNHHVAIFAEIDASGLEKRWEGFAVSRLQAMERKRRKLPVVVKTYGGAKNLVFKFSLMNGDLVEMDTDKGRGLFRLRCIQSIGALFLLPSTDARLVKDIMQAGDRKRISANTLRLLNCKKVVVDALGQLHAAND